MDQLDFGKDLQCPQCSRVLRRSQIPTPRLHPLARAIWIAIVPMGLVTVLFFMSLTVRGPGGPAPIPQPAAHSINQLGGVVSGALILGMVWLAMSMPRVRVIRCPHCGWSEKKVLRRSKD